MLSEKRITREVSMWCEIKQSSRKSDKFYLKKKHLDHAFICYCI